MRVPAGEEQGPQEDARPGTAGGAARAKAPRKHRAKPRVKIQIRGQIIQGYIYKKF